MSPETDRIPVPTNGKGPQAIEVPTAAPEAPSSDELSVGFTPTQLAVGFGVLASLIVIVARQLRGRGRRGSGRFGRR
jgi:hypothetical protein